MKKMVLLISGALTLTAFTPAAMFAAPSETSQINMEQQLQFNIDEEVFDAIGQIYPYIKVTDKGSYELNSKAKDAVGERVYERYIEAVKSINQSIGKREVIIRNGEIVVNPNYTHGGFSTNFYSNWYWWGYAITFSNAETKQIVRNLQETQSMSAFWLAVLAAVPRLQETAIPSAIYQGGLSLLINSFDSNNEGRGVTLNIHPGYYDVTSN